ncbi:hypothetical protein B0H19DRAFT_1084636 [Mycena capillaripes]|nr:hypothetical protein B0H19DRAFT_1084636 [Mycena capillaripes]
MQTWIDDKWAECGRYPSSRMGGIDANDDLARPNKMIGGLRWKRADRVEALITGLHQEKEMMCRTSVEDDSGRQNIQEHKKTKKKKQACQGGWDRKSTGRTIYFSRSSLCNKILGTGPIIESRVSSHAPIVVVVGDVHDNKSGVFKQLMLVLMVLEKVARPNRKARRERAKNGMFVEG